MNKQARADVVRIVRMVHFKLSEMKSDNISVFLGSLDDLVWERLEDYFKVTKEPLGYYKFELRG